MMIMRLGQRRLTPCSVCCLQRLSSRLLPRRFLLGGPAVAAAGAPDVVLDVPHANSPAAGSTITSSCLCAIFSSSPGALDTARGVILASSKMNKECWVRPPAPAPAPAAAVVFALHLLLPWHPLPLLLRSLALLLHLLLLLMRSLLLLMCSLMLLMHPLPLLLRSLSLLLRLLLLLMRSLLLLMCSLMLLMHPLPLLLRSLSLLLRLLLLLMRSLLLLMCSLMLLMHPLPLLLRSLLLRCCLAADQSP